MTPASSSSFEPPHPPLSTRLVPFQPTHPPLPYNTDILPLLDQALDATLFSFFQALTRFCDDECMLLSLSSSSSSSSSSTSSSCLALPTSLLSLVLHPNSSFRLRRYAFSLFLDLAHQPEVLTAWVGAACIEKGGGKKKKKKGKKEEEEEEEEEGFLPKLYSLFKAIFTPQLASAELQEGVGELLYRWIKALQKEEKKNPSSSSSSSSSSSFSSSYLITHVLPPTLQPLALLKSFAAFEEQLPKCLAQGNKVNRLSHPPTHLPFYLSRLYHLSSKTFIQLTFTHPHSPTHPPTHPPIFPYMACIHLPTTPPTNPPTHPPTTKPNQKHRKQASSSPSHRSKSSSKPPPSPPRPPPPPPSSLTTGPSTLGWESSASPSSNPPTHPPPPPPPPLPKTNTSSLSSSPIPSSLT